MDTDDDMVGSLSKKRVPYKSYDPSLMEKAMAAVQHDGKTMYRAAKDFGVPMNTLRDRLISKGIFKPKHSNVYTEGVTGRRRKKLPRDQWKQHITVDDDILERWHNIGRLEGLSSSAAIIRFLVSLYYGAGKQDEPKSDIRCQQCQNLLTLFCVNCQLFLQPTSSSQAVPLKQATDLDNLTITKIENENAPFSRKSVKGDLKNYFTPPERRSLRHKRSSRKTKNSSVFDVSSEEQSRSDEDQLPVDDWPDIEDISTGRDSNGNKADPSSCLDDILDSLQEQSQKKSRTKPHECPQCSETFLELSKLKWHFEETKHISEYICKKCNKSFKNKSALQQHSRVHNRQEHQCIKCGLSFKFPSRLSKHLKTHGSEKPHVCDMCGKSFVSVYYLRDHIKIHSEERRYKCDLCGAAFKQKPALYAHGKKHTNERPFQCQYCGLKFRDSQKVKIHVRTHTGEKPYKCDMCDASFVSNSNMWQHCAYVHGKSTKTHQCPECPLTFAAKGKLKVHMKNSHGSTDDTTSCQYEMIKQTLQPMYIEISETNHLVQI